MIGTAPVVVGVDGSPDSDRALLWALNDAAFSGSPLLVLTSFARPIRSEHGEDLVAAAQSHADRVLVDAAALAAPFPSVDVEVRRVDGLGLTPAAALVEASEGAAQVVVGARGHGGFSGLVLGSVSQHVARHARCSVVTVRASAEPASARVVVGIDGSEHADVAMAFALSRAAASGSPVTAVLAWRAASLHGAGVALPMSHDAGAHLRQHEEQLEAWVAPWRERVPAVELNAEAIPGHAAEVLLDASERASMVVVGSRGRGAFAGLLLGSVGQSVLHHARCPVAVAR